LNCGSDNGNLPSYCQASLHGIFNGAAAAAMVFRALLPCPAAYFRLALPSPSDRGQFQLRFVSRDARIPTDRRAPIDVSQVDVSQGTIIRDCE